MNPQRGLGVSWDVDLYGELLKIGGGKERYTSIFIWLSILLVALSSNSSHVCTNTILECSYTITTQNYEGKD